MFRASKTFKPQKKFPEGTLRFELHKKATASLNAGVNLNDAVNLPPGEDLNEWLAMHTVDFFNRVNLIYGAVCDQCTPESCPKMSGGNMWEYHWKDDVKYKKPTALCAPEYITLLMEWIEVLINDEKVFPSNPEIPFPKTFQNTVQQIFRRLFRVFVHIYYHHFPELTKIGAEAHTNTVYKHFYLFVTRFDLVPLKELEPLKDLTKSLLGSKATPVAD